MVKQNVITCTCIVEVINSYDCDTSGVSKGGPVPDQLANYEKNLFGFLYLQNHKSS